MRIRWEPVCLRFNQSALCAMPFRSENFFSGTETTSTSSSYTPKVCQTTALPKSRGSRVTTRLFITRLRTILSAMACPEHLVEKK